MFPVVTSQAVRKAEQAWFAAHPGEDLMARAASAVAQAAAEMLGDAESATGPARVLVVAGAGNNAGDSLFAAAELASRARYPVVLEVWPTAGSTHEAGLAAALAQGATVVTAEAALHQVASVSLIIDGVSGLGGRRGLSAPVAALAEAAESHQTPVLAVDLPSGIAADHPGLGASFRATRTVTFIGHKCAQVALPAASRCGVVTLVDIGVEVPSATWFAVEPADLASWYPWPGPMSDKYSRGVVGCDTGSETYPGAAVLSCSGALHAGAGLVRYAGPARSAVLAAHPSVVASFDEQHPGRVQAWVCGSGWPELDADRRARRLADGVPLVLDAAALLDPPSDLDATSVLTPHAGELAQLLGVSRSAVAEDPLAHARRAAQESGACVLLKGAAQYSVHPDGRVLIAEPGPAWSATAGSGDVLAGMIGALIAARVETWQAAALAASLQARAARACPGPHPPDHVASRGLPQAIATLMPAPPGLPVG
ncbi:MAG: bifunctional ADP-dependent NAD(P)H-hydrate dehydratase/NAD(P)H-hydrate epimerase [Propioniciclava sp.]